MSVLVDPSLKKDFEILNQYFGTDCSEIGDLDEVARLLALKAKPDDSYIKDCLPPWEKVYDDYLIALEVYQDHDSAWLETIKIYPIDVQMAMRNVIQVLINQHTTQNLKKQKRKVKTKEYLAQFKKLGYEFALNLIDDTVYVRCNGQQEILSDIEFSAIYRAVVDTGMPTRENDVRHSIHIAAKNNAFHPVRDYLDSLSWDGQPHIAKLADHFTDKYNIFPLYLRKWLIGAVARVYTRGAQNPMLVMDGKQGLGKSYFVRWLTPTLEVFNEGPIQPDNKDDQLRLMSVWIWEVKELGATFRKSDLEALKSFLTLESVRVRRPYGHYDIYKPAITSFIGTINNVEGFLSDPSGSRRFNITRILSIDWDYRNTVNRDLVWAEARAAFLDREDWMLSSEEQKIRDEINDDYAVEDPVENALPLYFDIDPGRQDWWMDTSEIVKILEDPYSGAGLRLGGSRAASMMLARIMMKLGCEKKQRVAGSTRIRGYVGIRRKIP